MDPFSITIGVVTLVEAGSHCSRVLRRIVGLRKAPTVLLELDNDVSELQTIISDVVDLVGVANHEELTVPQSLGAALECLKSALLELESFIAYKLTTMADDGSGLRIDKSVLLRSEEKLQVRPRYMIFIMRFRNSWFSADLQRQDPKSQDGFTARIRHFHFHDGIAESNRK